MSLYIYSPFTGEQIQVAINDFPNEMTWHLAMSACEGLGKGWRLPIKEELSVMYEQLHKQGKGNFKTVNEESYWSSSQYYTDSAFKVSLGSGSVDVSKKSNYFHVRAVRTLS